LYPDPNLFFGMNYRSTDCENRIMIKDRLFTDIYWIKKANL